MNAGHLLWTWILAGVSSQQLKPSHVLGHLGCTCSVVTSCLFMSWCGILSWCSQQAEAAEQQEHHRVQVSSSTYLHTYNMSEDIYTSESSCRLFTACGRRVNCSCWCGHTSVAPLDASILIDIFTYPKERVTLFPDKRMKFDFGLD